MGTQLDSDLQRRLRRYQKQYAELKNRIRPLGFICSGSLVQRHVRCGNPHCLCSRDTNMLHGPYYQLSWKKQGKSVSRFLSPEELRLYRQWINNRRKLMAITDKMHDISQQARDCLLPEKAIEKKHPARTSTPQRGRRSR